MHRLLSRYPSLAILWLTWFMPVVLAVIVLPPFGESIAATTWLLILACIAGATSGILLGANKEKQTKLPNEVLIENRICISVTAIGAAMGLMYWLLARPDVSSLEETRNSVHQGILSQSTLESYLYQLGGAVSLLAVSIATLTKRPLKYTIIVFLVSALAWTGVLLKTGGRVYVMALGALAVCGLFLRFTKFVLSIRGISCGLVALLLFISVNVVFVEARMESWFANAGSGHARVKKASTLIDHKAFLDNDLATTSAWLLLQFTSDPLYYLDYFLKYTDEDPSFGLYQFSIIANRVPNYDWMERRMQLDSMYTELGVTTNVWGTSLRDVIIDFGTWGGLVFYMAIGYLAGRLSISRTTGGRVLYIYVLMWLLYTPYNSPITLRPYQFAIYILIGWLIVTKLTSGGLSQARNSSVHRFTKNSA